MCLLEDIEILRVSCDVHSDNCFPVVAEALRALPFLPPRATLTQFLGQTHAALAYLGWKQHALEIASATHDWPQRCDAEFSRALFLRWLEETAATFGAARSDAGDHPYAPVQLLTVPQAQTLPWSTLTFA